MPSMPPQVADLEAACNVGDLHRVKELVEAGVDLNQPIDDFGCVGLALKNEHYDTARYLLEHGADPEFLIWQFPAVQIFASVNLDPLALPLLREHGADLHRLSSEGGSLLHSACWGNDQPGEAKREGLRYLLDQGLPIDLQDFKGNTALHESVAGDGPDYIAVEVLLEWGANLNIRNHRGETALLLAAHWSADDCIPLLLQGDADPTLRDLGGRTPLDVALSRLEYRRENLRDWKRKTAHFSESPIYEDRVERWIQSETVRRDRAEKCVALLSNG